MTTAASYPDFDGTQACAEPGLDVDLFFPPVNPTKAQVRAAVDVCARCLFREPCGAYAITHAVSGIWGGLTEAVRGRVQRRHGIHPAALDLPQSFTSERTSE